MCFVLTMAISYYDCFSKGYWNVYIGLILHFVTGFNILSISVC